MHLAIQLLKASLAVNSKAGSGQQLLVLCDEYSQELQQLQNAEPRLHYQDGKTFVSHYHASATRRWPLIVVLDVNNDLLAHPGLLACARDCAGDKILLWNDQASLSDLLALGFRRLEKTPDTFVFDLYDYKKRPDWFNADNFAHPQRWNALN